MVALVAIMWSPFCGCVASPRAAAEPRACTALLETGIATCLCDFFELQLCWRQMAMFIRWSPPDKLLQEKHPAWGFQFFPFSLDFSEKSYLKNFQHPHPLASSKLAGACDNLISIKFDPPATALPAPAALPFAASWFPGKLVANFRNKLFTL